MCWLSCAVLSSSSRAANYVQLSRLRTLPTGWRLAVVSEWVAVVGCRFGLHVWVACLGCMFGLPVWIACLGCMFCVAGLGCRCGLHVWVACLGDDGCCMDVAGS